MTVSFVAPIDTMKLEVKSATGERCTMPCSLQLPPGEVELSIGGEVEHWQQVLVPPEGGTLRLGFVPTGAAKFGKGLFVVGIVLGAVGLATLPLMGSMGAIPLLVLGGGGLVTLLGGMALKDRVQPELDWVPPAPPIAPPSAAPLARRTRRSGATHA